MRAPVFRSPSPMQNPCSSSPFFLSLSKNYSKTVMKIACKMGVCWVHYMSRYMANIMTKQSKTAGSRRGTRRKTAQSGEATSTTAVGLTTVRPWLPPRPGRGGHWLWWLGFFPCAAFWSFGSSPWTAGFCLSWGILGLFLLSSVDPHGPNFFSLDSSQTFLPKSTAWIIEICNKHSTNQNRV